MKFLRKSSVLKDCWMIDEEMGRVPLEISLLARLSHPNIVQVCTENQIHTCVSACGIGDALSISKKLYSCEVYGSASVCLSV